MSRVAPSWALLVLVMVVGIESVMAAERIIDPVATGPNRLEIDAALLSGSEPLRYEGDRFVGGLEDLRISQDSEEIPYLLIAPRRSEERWVPGSVLPVRATKTTSGFEADLGEVRTVDAVRLPDVPAPFLKRFQLEGSGDRRRWTLLEDEGTFFDLPSEGLALREVEFSPGDYRYLRITWDDRSSGRMALPRRVEARLLDGASHAPVRFPLELERRPSEPGRSRYHLTLPASNLPARAIVLESGEETLSRTGSVSEIRLTGGEAAPVELGRSLLRKLEQEGVTAHDLRIPIRAPHGPELELVVDDGDNPPLLLERAFVELPPLPWIYFEAVDGGPLVARWGDPATQAPRYDLEAKRDAVAAGEVSEAAWGPARAVESGRPTEPFPSLRGAPIDRELFTWMKRISDSPAGLTSLLVDAEALARSNDLADLRVVTDDQIQVPYLIERRDEPLEIGLELGDRTRTDDGRSRYEVRLPWSTLPNETRVTLRTEERIFDRGIVIVTTEAGRDGPEVLASARWTHAEPHRGPRPLVVDAPLRGHDRIAIVVDEGDNAPLTISGAALLVPSVRLRFVRDANTKLSLLYGASSMDAPRYDIELLASHLFGRGSNEIEPGPETPLREIPSEAAQTRWFWIVVAISAIVLLLVIGRIVRNV